MHNITYFQIAVGLYMPYQQLLCRLDLRLTFTLWAICSKIKTRVLPTFLEQNYLFNSISNIFCPKNVGKTHVFIFEQMAHEIFQAICSKNKNTHFIDIFGTKLSI